jgi:hypothetical protein
MFKRRRDMKKLEQVARLLATIESQRPTRARRARVSLRASV